MLPAALSGGVASAWTDMGEPIGRGASMQSQEARPQLAGWAPAGYRADFGRGGWGLNDDWMDVGERGEQGGISKETTGQQIRAGL